MTLSPAELDDLKSRPENDCAEIAGKWVRLRKRGGRIMGPCPLCSTDPQGRTAARFEIKDHGQAWTCAVCRDGGDVIKLVMKHEYLEFRAAVEWLGGARVIDPAVAERRAKERAEKRAESDAKAERYRQDTRKRMYAIWNGALPIAGTLAEAYLRHRGIDPPSFDGLRLRFVAELPFFDGEEEGEDGRKYARIIYRGPALVAPITDNAGKFRGCQFTCIDLAQRNGKAVIIDPDTGEPVDVKGRKSRGSTAAAHIDLIGSRQPEQIIAGEGTETTLSTWYALAASGIDLSKTAFWALIDVGNIGGRAIEQIHYRDADGKPLQCPGPDPDLAEPGVALPASVKDVVLLGDNKNQFMVHCALYRGAQRWRAANEALTVRVAWAPEGMDFNDMVRGEPETAVAEGV